MSHSISIGKLVNHCDYCQHHHHLIIIIIIVVTVTVVDVLLIFVLPNFVTIELMLSVVLV